ncbi:hypothetical protein ACET3X_000215 [Alternaria dauci]|uniref:DUF833-domain-containing protein n=1 Tax=Alternaria dauci TaxID=48095 RepID=A0ABR3UUW6_9PLEO
MCIAILTTAHPDYPFILLNNRDEYLHRPTAEATWWPSPDNQVLGGYDLHRPAHGTWLGVTRQGRIAVLTNYREEDEKIIEGARSRGLIPNAWLKSDPAKQESTEDFAKRMIEEDGVKGVGGFSLCYGFIQDVVKEENKGLAIVSNRTPDVHGVIQLLQKPNETHALSNAAYGDRTWPKVINGEDWTRAAIAESVAAKESQDQLINRFLDILTTDTMPRQKENEEWDMYLNQLRYSIFVPAIGRDHLEEHKMPAHELTAAMCIMFFMSHYDGPREHFLGSHHCAHIDCPGTFEAHQKYRLEESRLDCSECLAEDGDEVDPDIVPVQYYPPIPHFEIEYVEGKGWVKVCEQDGEEGKERGTAENDQEEGQDDGRYARSFASLSDCDSVTSHWRLDSAFPSPIRPTAAATMENWPAPSYQTPPMTEEAYETRSPHEPPHEMAEVCEVSYEYGSASPGQDPYQPVPQEFPFEDSPNTVEHRYLVNRQLATLEHEMAHCQPQHYPSQPMFNVLRSQHMNNRRQNSNRRFAANRPPGYTIPPPVNPQPRPPPGMLPGGPVYENGFWYIVSANTTNGVPNFRWGPVPGPGESIDLPSF